MTYNSLTKKVLLPAAAVALSLTMAVAGCKSARTDQQITADIQGKIGSEGALAGQNIQVAVANGVATLNGVVTDEASRALAANDSGSVAGVKTVINNLTVQSQTAQAAPPQATPSSAAPAPQPAPLQAQHETRAQRREREREERRERRQQQGSPSSSAPAPSEPMTASAPPPQPVQPPPPPRPTSKDVTLPAGTVLPVRLTETLSSKDAQANDVFHGTLASDLGTQGVIAIPRGTPVMGRVIDAREAAHFKGASLLTIELTELNARGKRITLATDSFSKEGAARGKNTAEKAGGGAALGAIIGAIAGGGKGAAIGGLAGGAAGTGINAATRGQQAVIPTETVVNFKLQSPITLTVPLHPSPDDNVVRDPQLQQRQ